MGRLKILLDHLKIKTMFDEHKRSDRAFDMDVALQRYLMDYRSTKHYTTNETPARLMMGRELKTKLSLLKPHSQEKTVNQAKEVQVKHFKGRRNIYYGVGQKVVVKDYSDPNNSKWEDAEVIKVIGPRSYIVELKTGRTIKRHIDQIRDNILESDSYQDNNRRAQGGVRTESTSTGKPVVSSLEGAVSVCKRDLKVEKVRDGGESNDACYGASDIEMSNENDNNCINDCKDVVSSGNNENLITLNSNIRKSVRMIQKPIRYRQYQ